MNFRNPIIGIVASCIACAALTSYSLLLRHKVESLNKAVTIAAEADEIESLGAVEGKDFESALATMKSLGLNGVVVSEESVGQLVSDGAVEITSKGATTSSDPTVQMIGTSEVISRIERGIRNRFELGASQVSLSLLTSVPPKVQLQIRGVSAQVLKTASVGYNPMVTFIAKKQGMEIIGRNSNPPGVTDRGVRETLRWAHEQGAKYFLPSGEQLLGRRNATKAFAEALAEFQMIYACPEFAKIGGDPAMLAEIPERSVRLHAAQANEVDKLTESGYVERYIKASSERSVRILLLRPLSYGTAKPLTDFASLTKSIAAQARKEGASILPAHPFEDAKVPKWLFAGIGLSIAPMAYFVFCAFVSNRNLRILTGLFLLAVGLGCWTEAARNYAALLGSIAFPVGGFILMEKMPRNGIVRYFGLAAVSVLGGMCVAGLLNGLPYLLRADQFTGVKLAVFLPIVVAGYYYFRQLRDSKATLDSPIRWAQAGIGILLLATLGFMISRTGNDNPAGVSGVELQLRSLLENLLVVRPRTKEFLIGYPALVIGIMLLNRCQASPKFQEIWGGWTALSLLVGAVGITSMVNTLCHLHTPIGIGFVRIAFGLILGGIFGVALWGAMRATIPSLKNKEI